MATRGEREGEGLHFPRSPKSSVYPRLRPTELHYRLISSALHARPIAILGSDYRILSADIPETMRRDGFQADETAFSRRK